MDPTAQAGEGGSRVLPNAIASPRPEAGGGRGVRATSLRQHYSRSGCRPHPSPGGRQAEPAEGNNTTVPFRSPSLSENAHHEGLG